jgi:hypothetical protein
MVADGTGRVRGKSFAETLRLRHGRSTPNSSPPLVGLEGGKETTLPSSPALTVTRQ